LKRLSVSLQLSSYSSNIQDQDIEKALSKPTIIKVIKAATAAIFKIKTLKRLSVSLQLSRLSRQLQQEYSRSRY
jgi:uncharacterized protein (DUF2252 family)